MAWEGWLRGCPGDLDVCVGGIVRPGVTGSSLVLGDILQASDNLSRVISSYKTVVEGQVVNGEVVTSAIPDSEGKVFWFPTPSGAAWGPAARPRCRVTLCQPTGLRGPRAPLSACREVTQGLPHPPPPPALHHRLDRCSGRRPEAVLRVPLPLRSPGGAPNDSCPLLFPSRKPRHSH